MALRGRPTAPGERVNAIDREAWALERVFEALDRLVALPSDPSLLQALIARRREHLAAVRFADGVRARRAMQPAIEVRRRGRPRKIPVVNTPQLPLD